ncbi:MAG: DUF1998 domain-containing protein [Candidatus Eisenbacteria bacterium]
MGSRQIRVGQLIAPFGPGSIYTDRSGVPHVVAGLDHWFMRWDHAVGKMLPSPDRAEFERFEPRLSELLRVNRFCTPPDFRFSAAGEPPPNAGLYIPALRFPRWYRHTRTGELRRFNLASARIERPSGGGRWQPVRFISVCAAGHLCEFPWKEWIGCQCAGDGNLSLTDRGGSELTSIRVECRACPVGSSGRGGRNLANTTVKPDVLEGERSAFQSAGITCPGERPWLGEGAVEAGCTQPLVGALINQTNIYFPRTISAITLPDLQIADDSVAALRVAIEQEPACIGIAKTLWRMGSTLGAIDLIKGDLERRGIVCDSDQLRAALASLFAASQAAMASGVATPGSPEGALLQFRRMEFNILRNEIDDSDHVADLRVVATSVPWDLSRWIGRVTLVERLREVRAFYGFDRLEQAGAPLASMPDSGMQQLFRTPPTQVEDYWLPAVEVFGEGIYVELREEEIQRWFVEHWEWLVNRIDANFLARMSGEYLILPPLAPADLAWASRYLLVHSFAHILINQLVYECGYSTASLRERLYVSADVDAPMAGLLIYTAAGDSEGTLGGLVQLGRPERLGAVVHRALSRASWCSADPVCSEHLGGRGARMVNLAACHACILLPETSCETVNSGLDRAVVVGTPDAREHGFMAALLEGAFALG